MKKRISLTKYLKIFLFFSAAVFISSCGRKKHDVEYVARVNDSYLTHAELYRNIDTSKGKHNFKEEFIRNWIESELLYQSAVKKGMLDTEEFSTLLEEAKKELAKSLLLKKLYSKEDFNYDPREIENFYNASKEKFVLLYNAGLINQIDFNNEDKAIQFRTIAVESDWNKAYNLFRGDSSLVEAKTNQLLFDYEISPLSMARLIQQLAPAEISVVIRAKPNLYTVVQKVEMYLKDDVPKYEVIKDKVEARFIFEKKEKFVREYIQALYANNEIEVKN